MFLPHFSLFFRATSQAVKSVGSRHMKCLLIGIGRRMWHNIPSAIGDEKNEMSIDLFHNDAVVFAPMNIETFFKNHHNRDKN